LIRRQLSGGEILQCIVYAIVATTRSLQRHQRV
jgi:hypothetical protein